MSDYYIKAILLEECSYSKKARELLEKHNIKAEIITVNHNNKEQYKTNQINTFPQIYLCKNNNKGSQLLGGYNDLADFFEKFKDKELDMNNVINFGKKYLWSKKGILRLIQLINL